VEDALRLAAQEREDAVGGKPGEGFGEVEVVLELRALGLLALERCARRRRRHDQVEATPTSTGVARFRSGGMRGALAARSRDGRGFSRRAASPAGAALPR